MIEMGTMSADALVAAEAVIDDICLGGGLNEYDKYLHAKQKRFAAIKKVMQMGHMIQQEYFPGDPGEDVDQFDNLDYTWQAEDEPKTAELDLWCRKLIPSKAPIRRDLSMMDDPPSSMRSKGAYSHVSGRSKKSVATKGKGDKSKMGGSSDITMDKNKDISNVTKLSKMTEEEKQELNFYQLLDVPPPREIPEDEKILREKKEKQLKLKAVEDALKAEEDERERERLRKGYDEWEELQKVPHTFSDTGDIIMIQVPNAAKFPATNPTPQVVIDNFENTTASVRNQYAVKIRVAQIKQQSAKSEKTMKTDKSGKSQRTSELPESAAQSSRVPSSRISSKKLASTLNLSRMQKTTPGEQELKDDLARQEKQMKDDIMNSIKEAGMLGQDGPPPGNGILMIDQNGRKKKGKPLAKTQRMTLSEYASIANDFQVMSEDEMMKYESNKKLTVLDSQEDLGGNLRHLKTQQDHRSPDRVIKSPQADVVLLKDLVVKTSTTRIGSQSRRRDLKSATAKSYYNRVINGHNKQARLASAKTQLNDKFTKTSSKKSLFERVYNYEEFIENADGPIFVDDLDNPKESVYSIVEGKKHMDHPTSMIDEFNKRLLDQKPVPEIPIIQNKVSMTRPTTAKSRGLLVAHHNFETVPTRSEEQFKKMPRERIISAKLPRQHNKLAQPPYGKTMGHGLISVGSRK